MYRCCDHQRVECNRTGARRAEDWVTDKTARRSTAKKAAARARGGGDGPLLGGGHPREQFGGGVDRQDIAPALRLLGCAVCFVDIRGLLPWVVNRRSAS